MGSDDILAPALCICLLLALPLNTPTSEVCPGEREGSWAGHRLADEEAQILSSFASK